MLCIYAFEIGEFINHFYSFRSRNQSLLSAPEEGKGGKSLKSVSLLSWSTDMVSQGGRGGEVAGGKSVVDNNDRSLNTPPIYFCVLFVLFSGRCAYERQLFWIRLKIHTHTQKNKLPPSKKKGKKWLLPLGFTCIQTASVIKNARWVTPSSIMDVPFQRKTIYSIHV